MYTREGERQRNETWEERGVQKCSPIQSPPVTQGHTGTALCKLRASASCPNKWLSALSVGSIRYYKAGQVMRFFRLRPKQAGSSSKLSKSKSFDCITFYRNDLIQGLEPPGEFWKPSD